MAAWAIALICVSVAIVSLLLGAFLGYRFTKKLVKKELKENPPINEAMIRAMYSQMGRTPSESQIKQVIAAMKKQQK